MPWSRRLVANTGVRHHYPLPCRPVNLIVDGIRWTVTAIEYSGDGPKVWIQRDFNPSKNGEDRIPLIKTIAAAGATIEDAFAMAATEARAMAATIPEPQKKVRRRWNGSKAGA